MADADAATTTTPAWVETIVAAHTSVAGSHVSHYARLIHDSRYFCWTDDDREDLNSDNGHNDRAVTGFTDLFTKQEFDPWAEQLEAAFDAAGILWEKTGVSFEPDTGYIHHTWDWTVVF